ncbi:MAG: NIPSNAP family protein [Planctomycetota bacterium]|nr:NIPSNAP family protein [Planctomycetota bacterium]MDA1250198.1 NIPSNAP family protein [Planctomycetota bacterium]
MTQNIPRRDFLAGSIAAAAALSTSDTSPVSAADPAAKQEFYELRTYRNGDAAKQKVVLNFVETALRPALNRQGIDRIGIFQNVDEKDASVFVVIPYASLDQLAMQNDKLEQDEAYHKAAADYFALPVKDAAFTRIESRLLRAFKGMPVLAAPSTESASRLVELRIYESHNEHLAKLKVEMFNEGEIAIMKDVKLAPVFFGETLISGDVPNLTYMLSADSPEAHDEHWVGFRKHPEWDRMKNLARYQGTVSKIVSIKMTPTAGSQI